jgi:hypothetical protein
VVEVTRDGRSSRRRTGTGQRRARSHRCRARAAAEVIQRRRDQRGRPCPATTRCAVGESGAGAASPITSLAVHASPSARRCSHCEYGRTCRATLADVVGDERAQLNRNVRVVGAEPERVQESGRHGVVEHCTLLGSNATGGRPAMKMPTSDRRSGR